MITVNHTARVVVVDGELVQVPRQLFDLLVVLIEDPERVVPAEEIEARIWGGNPGRSRALSAATVRLRRALGGKYVHNVWGVGYRLLPAEAITIS